MDLSQITSQALIFVDQPWTTQTEILDHLITAFADQGVITDAAAFRRAVEAREQISQTGMDNGFAIPHGKSATVKTPQLAIATLKTPLQPNDWPSIDEANRVEAVFLIAVPEDQAGDSHLKILSQLSTQLMDPAFVDAIKAAQSPAAVLAALQQVKQTATPQLATSGKHLLAITACATGIAHTYMAAEALQKAAATLGVEMKVEKQGANGIEDAITPAEIKAADGIIFATDIAAKEKGRFEGMPFVQVKVAAPLKDAAGLIDRVLTNPDGEVEADGATTVPVDVEKKQSVGSTLMQAVMTGISYMIPVLVAAGIMIGIGQIGASAFGLSKTISDAAMATNPNQIVRILHFIALTGSFTMTFMYPVFTAFMAYSIADRPGLAAGFVGGAFAAGLHNTLWGITTGVPSGFFGALILGAVVGYVCKFLRDKIHLPKNLSAMKPMLIISGLSILAVFFVNYFLVDPVFGGLNQWLQQTVVKYQDSGNVVLSVIISCLTAFDLGGPVNKAAGAVAIGMAADKVFPLTPRVLAIVIPPIGVGLATIIDKYVVGRRVFDENLRVTGRTSLLLGFLAIGEGAIPFALQNPLITIPINMIGASLGSVTAVLLGAVQWLPLPAIWGWPLVENFPAYLLGIIVGVGFIALANVFVRFALIKRKEAKQGK
ncbi:fructose-specific PTS transporter subunit EIIC [Lacticaseibacillus absianus]|uniref:fructose-specific PTS transporter subunit EIIC n=1 Tax=Lacticaseibacillus absianus TaxID=2729623 RepID=UPI0015CCD52F|nr:fructose-specific PTS transporter subunit EIIC [Lacticaseibacillus absianus]